MSTNHPKGGKQPRWTRENGCPFCGPTNRTTIIQNNLKSNFYCNECKAIFQSLELDDMEEAGKFAGRYAPHTKSSVVNNSFANKKEDTGEENG